MNKLISALVVGFFAVSAYAADVEPTATPADKPAAHSTKMHHASKKAHASKKTAPAAADIKKEESAK